MLEGLIPALWEKPQHVEHLWGEKNTEECGKQGFGEEQGFLEDAGVQPESQDKEAKKQT